ncbi:hypothetical protein MMC18_005552 [Xylographa bjoerkii]|nr:hypothetical protein [Xylographa bjoerkii]
MKLVRALFLLPLPLLPSTLAQTYKASFTKYGQGDNNGSPNCNTATAACGFYNYPGYNAAVSQVRILLFHSLHHAPLSSTSNLPSSTQYTTDSNIPEQNLFGVGPGAGAGPACGTCWQLTPKTDSSGNALKGAKTIVVKVNNLCPAQGNSLCAQNGLSGTNQYGANVNFDTCIDDGASAALFGTSGVGLAVGTATKVSCSSWSGSNNIT